MEFWASLRMCLFLNWVIWCRYSMLKGKRLFVYNWCTLHSLVMRSWFPLKNDFVCKIFRSLQCYLEAIRSSPVIFCWCFETAERTKVLVDPDYFDCHQKMNYYIFRLLILSSLLEDLNKVWRMSSGPRLMYMYKF